ncbi:MlaD family protein [Nocardia jiangxiensis]|uniref:MlaD family protein n=1 Tax=Nocardia jiangxiensis TaxID=282685 RepID=A0ABW6S918_9NOCA
MMKHTVLQRFTRHAQHVLRVAAAAGIAALALTINGCAFDPAGISVPGTTVSGKTYPLHIQFANVLNLPPGAKVLANGVEIGTLTGMHIVGGHPGYVLADVGIEESMHLPADVTAELQQSTPLGDVHIALTTTPGSAAAALPPGATIPLSHTTQAPQIEDTLAGLATAIGSGAVTDIQNTVRQLNTTLPADPKDTAHIFGVLGSDLTGVSTDLGSLDRLLDGLNGTTDVVSAKMAVLQRMLTPEGVEHLTGSVNAVISIFYIFAGMGPMAHSALWLGPVISASDSAAKAFVPLLLGNRPLDLNAPTNLKLLVDLIENKLIPFTEHGAKVNLVHTTVSGSGSDAVSTTDQTDRIIRTLRMIGAVR